MIRFIDLRFQGTQNRFAFWTTVEDRFIRLAGDEAWTTWNEFEEAVRFPPLQEGADADPEDSFLERFRRLCPPWVFDDPKDEELDFRDGVRSGRHG